MRSPYVLFCRTSTRVSSLLTLLLIVLLPVSCSFGLLLGDATYSKNIGLVLITVSSSLTVVSPEAIILLIPNAYSLNFSSFKAIVTAQKSSSHSRIIFNFSKLPSVNNFFIDRRWSLCTSSKGYIGRVKTSITTATAQANLY